MSVVKSRNDRLAAGVDDASILANKQRRFRIRTDGDDLAIEHRDRTNDRSLRVHRANVGILDNEISKALTETRTGEHRNNKNETCELFHRKNFRETCILE